MTTIKVIESHPVLRFGLQQLISDTLPHANIEGLDYLDSADSTDTECDLVLLSVSSNDALLEQIEAVKRACGPKAILLLIDSNAIRPMICHEHPVVRDIIRKDMTSELLQASVKLVLAGGTCFPAQSTNEPAKRSPFSLYQPMKWPLTSVSDPEPHAESEEAKMLGLTPRQYEVLVLLAEGHPLKTVGRRLNISVATAKAHTETLYRRLDVHNRNAAVYTAVSRGATLGWSNVTANRSSGSRPDRS